MAFGFQVIDLNNQSFSLGTAKIIEDTVIWDMIEGNGKIKALTNFTLNDVENRDVLISMAPSGQTFVGAFMLGAVMYYVVASAVVQDNKTFTQLIFQNTAPASVASAEIKEVEKK